MSSGFQIFLWDLKASVTQRCNSPSSSWQNWSCLGWGEVLQSEISPQRCSTTAMLISPVYTFNVSTLLFFSTGLTFSLNCNWYWSNLSCSLIWQKCFHHAIGHNGEMYFGRGLLHPTSPWGQHSLWYHLALWLYITLNMYFFSETRCTSSSANNLIFLKYKWLDDVL